MSRIIIDLDPEDKHRLDDEARKRHVSIEEPVRQVIQAYKTVHKKIDQSTLRKMLMHTAGIWRSDEGLTYQNNLHDEWNRQP
jgi:aspartate oxidase